MIRIMDKYGIEVSEKCYAAGKICKSTDKKTGEVREILQAPAYCTSILNAIEAIRRRLHMEAVKSFDGPLDEAVSRIREADERLTVELSKIKF